MYSDSFHSFKHLHKYLMCELGNAKPIQIPNTTSDSAFDIMTISLLRNSLKFEKKKKQKQNKTKPTKPLTLSNEASTSKHKISKNNDTHT